MLADYIKELISFIPKEVIFAVIIVVVLTECTKKALAGIETMLEEKKGKQIKFFDHTKIIFVTLWSLVAAILLAVAEVFAWKQLPLYGFCILGAAVAAYEYIIKKVKVLWE